jgi:AraC-like DNA-binding protein
MNGFIENDLEVGKINSVLLVPKGAGEGRHRNRAFHGVVMEFGGSKCYRFPEGQKMLLNKGDIIFLPRFSNYNVELVRPGNCIAFNFLFEGNHRFEPFMVSPQNRAPAATFFKFADTVWNSKKRGYVLKTKSLLYDVLYLVSRCLDMGNLLIKTKLQKAMEIIESCYYKTPIRISELAEISGMSEVYFRKQFHAVYGTSPLKFINSLKITRSIELLESKMYSVKEVAFMSGFEDEYYFSREFSKAMGVPPREYKRSIAR